MNLLISYTPFHTFMLGAIETREELQPCKLLLFVTKKSLEKNNYYLERLLTTGKKIEVSVITRSRFELLNYLKVIFIAIKWRHSYSVSSVFCGNYKLALTRILIGILEPTKLVSFDDGVGTLSGKGWFYDREVKLSELFFSVFNMTYSYSNVSKLIDHHYSLDPSRSNPYTTNVSAVNLKILSTQDVAVGQRHFTLVKPHQKLSVLLLPSYAEERRVLTQEQQSIAVSRTVSKFNIDIIIPHPLSDTAIYEKSIEKLCLKMPLIAEDFILQCARSHDLTVYGFRSSSLFILTLIESGDDLSEIEVFNLDLVQKNTKMLSTLENDLWMDLIPTHYLDISGAE